MQSFNEMIAVRSGNVLLRHWTLATDNFIFTDLPPMLLASIVVGRNHHLIYLVPFAVFAVMVGTSMAIVRRCAGSAHQAAAGSFFLLLLLGVPFGLLYNFFFWSDFHVATVAMCLLAILAVAPGLSGQTLPYWRLPVFSVLVLAATFSDPLAEVLLTGPIVATVAMRAWSQGVFRPAEWLVVGCAALGSVAGVVTLHLLLRSQVSFTALPSVSADLVPNASAALGDLHAVVGGLQVLFTARGRLISTLHLHGLISTFRLFTVALVVLLCCSVLWRVPRAPRSGVAQLLVLGALGVALSATFSATFASAVSRGADFPGAAIRFTVPIFVFLCVAAALEFSDAARRRPGWLLPLGLCFGLVQATGAAEAALHAADRPAGVDTGADAGLATWLLQQHLTYGIGDYWDTQLVEALTSGAVKLDPVVNTGGHLSLWNWVTDTSRFGSRNPPQFAVIRPDGLFRVDLPSVTAAYGAPVSITEVANQFFVVRLRDGAKRS